MPDHSDAPEIRPATAAHLGAVAEIFAHYVTQTVITFTETPPTPDDWGRKLAELAERSLPFLVAEVNGQVAGFAYAGPWRAQPAYRHTAEDSIYLSPDHTGRGLGRALLEALLARCAEAGVRQLIAVIADADNDASPALHRKFGFRDAGRLTAVGHKHGRWLDTLLLQRDLPSSGPNRPLRPIR
ncbi:GNAT family N-acetyltransferase [Streptomyces sp. NBC_01803]|uniref:GNAT family N-acetyltransferase n=1 Tax=Streptomyces sp. NBC_01803 TaxID=2975946 RepID=UPI002DDBDD25|nr:GNAT family N-acetyltransferase [Streptomyces sp. NBC_01803]WSA46320.1 GNAT family N-acetyltransferase [Streptomyces sp. NBC_01803]